jgi:hypothetical protein
MNLYANDSISAFLQLQPDSFGDSLVAGVAAVLFEFVLTHETKTRPISVKKTLVLHDIDNLMFNIKYYYLLLQIHAPINSLSPRNPD